MKYFLLTVTVVAIALAIAGINVANGRKTNSVIRVRQPTAELDAAVKRARAQLPVFISRILKPQDGDLAFALQARIVGSNKVVEHIWVDNLTYVDNHFEGTLAENPFALPNLKKGDLVEVRRNEVSDWMIKRSNAEIIGGFARSTLSGGK